MKRLTMIVAILGLSASLMATVFSRQVSVTTSPTRIDANTSGEQITLINQAATSVFIGPSNVTTSTGMEIKANAAISLQLVGSEKLYGVTAATTNRVDVLESGR